VATQTDRFGTTTFDYLQNNILHHEPITITDPLGRVTTLTRDLRERVTSRTENGVTITFNTDRNGRPTLTDYGNGVSVKYAYDGGYPTWTSIEGATFGSVRRAFWGDGKLRQVTEPNGDSRQFYYDANRRLRREVDELGNPTDYVRDDAGRVTEVHEVASGAVTRFTHDDEGRVVSRSDALNHGTSMTYRAGGRLASLTDARSHTRTFSETPTSRTVVDALNRTTVRSLSAYGLSTGTSLPGGTSTSVSYLGKTREDESQRFPLSVTDEASRVRTYGYDANNGMTSATDLGGANGWTYSYAPTKSAQITWDAESGQVILVPVDSRATAYELSSSDGHFTSELKSVTTPLGSTTTYNRDAAGRPSSVTLPWGATKTYGYTDADALPETVTLPQGTTLTYAYDSAKREVSRTSSAGESRSFVYGAGDRLLSMTDATGTTTYSYDTLGRFAGITYPFGGSVAYTRDLLGRVVRQEVRATATAAAQVTQYAYDAVGNLMEVVDPLGGSTTFVYDAENRLTTRTLPNGVVTTYTYDLRDRPLSVVHTNANGVVLASRTYVRAAGGEPTKITKQDGSYVLVGYDSALRITSERYFDGAGVAEESIAYTYDADGNRATKTVDGVVSTYAYASGGRLTGITTNGVTESRTTDGGGRETSLAVGGEAATLSYDSDDHVTRVVKNGVTTTYGFDAMGQRVGVLEGGARKRYLSAPNMGRGHESPQAVVNEAGEAIANFVYAGEMPLMKITSSGTEYYLGDAMGTVLAKTDTSGSAVDRFDYDGFGSPRGQIGGVPNDTYGDFRFQGMWLDPTSLYYVRARTYDAAAGRFTSRDPFSGLTRTPETQYPYAFCQSNPYTWADPSGRMTLVESMAVTVGMGVLASVSSASMQHYLNNARGFQRGSQLGQAATNFTSGFGDTLSLGVGSAVRGALFDVMGWKNEVDQQSGSYLAGSAAAMLASIYQGMLFTAAASLRAEGVLVSQTIHASQVSELGAQEGTVVLGHYSRPVTYEIGQQTITGVQETLPILERAAQQLGGKTLSALPGTMDAMAPELAQASRIVFFTSPGMRGLTMAEMQMIQGNPALMAKTIFVYGAF